MTKQFIIGIMVVLIWFVLGIFEFISWNECVIGLIAFTIGTNLVGWEVRDENERKRINKK